MNCTSPRNNAGDNIPDDANLNKVEYDVVHLLRT